MVTGAAAGSLFRAGSQRSSRPFDLSDQLGPVEVLADAGAEVSDPVRRVFWLNGRLG